MAVKPLWAAGSWANPPLVVNMHKENVGPIVNMDTIQRKMRITNVENTKQSPYVRVRIASCVFLRNVALSSGGNQATFGGGLAVSNGPYVVESSVFAYNTATEGDSVAAVGESMYYACNDNDPPLPWVKGPDCSVKVGDFSSACSYVYMYT